MSTVYDFTATSLAGQPVELSAYKGNVILIVNTASACGFTPQYEGMEKIYQQFKDQGFVVLGFPCNQFGAQEPGSSADIGAFCQKNYGVHFPMFEKINVNGDKTHPLYQFLKSQAPGVLGSEAIKWNFTKFLIKKDGTHYKRYAPLTKPEDLVADITQLLSE